MSTFDYVSVLLSIVLSLALAHVLTGVARLIQNGVSRFSIPLAGWMGFMALLCVDYWISLWAAHEQQAWPLLFILFMLSFAATLYILCFLIVPEPEGDAPVDMAAFFEGRRRKFFAGIIFYCVMGETSNLMLPGFGDLRLAGFILAYVLLFAAGWVWASNRVQIAVVVGMYLLYAAYAWLYTPGL